MGNTFLVQGPQSPHIKTIIPELGIAIWGCAPNIGHCGEAKTIESVGRLVVARAGKWEGGMNRWCTGDFLGTETLWKYIIMSGHHTIQLSKPMEL